MARNLKTGSDFGSKLAQAIGLPSETVWFELRCAVDEIVTVKASILVRSEDGALEQVLREFTLSVEPKNG